MKALFSRIVILIAGLALLDFVLHPQGQDYNFHSAIYRAVTVLVLMLMPFTLLVGFLIVRRVPGNVVGPLLIVWSGTIAYNSMREEIGPALFGLYYAYDLVFGWMALFLMFLHFPDGEIHPQGAARWIYRQLVFNILLNSLIFLSTEPLQVPSQAANFYLVPGLLPYAGLVMGLGLLLIATILVLVPISLVLRYRKSSLLERQQIKWLALLGGSLVIYTVLVGIAYPLLTGGEVMNPGSNLSAMRFYIISGLFPPLAIGISVLRYRLLKRDISDPSMNSQIRHLLREMGLDRTAAGNPARKTSAG